MIYAQCWSMIVKLLVIPCWLPLYYVAMTRARFPVSAVWKKQKMFLSHPSVKVSIMGSLRDREVASRPQTTRARISNPVSGGQCHLNHLTMDGAGKTTRPVQLVPPEGTPPPSDFMNNDEWQHELYELVARIEQCQHIKQEIHLVTTLSSWIFLE